jgi:hypothetical protein
MMKTGCIKTGADVWIDSHGAMAHGDLYRLGDENMGHWYILRAVTVRNWSYGTHKEDSDCIFLTEMCPQNRMWEFGNWETIVIFASHVVVQKQLYEYLHERP